MGQYHAVYNEHRREKFCMGGAKLLEQCDGLTALAFLYLLSNSNGRGGGDIARPESLEAVKLEGSWLNCRVVVQGDYAEKEDKCFLADTKGYRDITDLLMEVIQANGGSDA